MRTVDGEPEDHGFSSDRLERLTELLHGYVDSGRLPCVVTQVCRDGHVVYRDAHGWADIEADRKVAADDVFRIYSMTKPIASMALMMLYEEGRVLLENPVTRWVPELADVEVWAGGDEASYTTTPAEREITVHDVLTHVAGLTTGFQHAHPLDALYRARALGDFDQQPDYDLAGCMALLGELPLLHQPGAAFSYGMSTEVVARIVEVASGQRFGEFLRQRIFDPLGMDETGFWADGPAAERLVACYGRNRRKELVPIARSGAGAYHSRPHRFESGAGGLVSTLDDYQRFADALLGRGERHGVRLVGPKTFAAMTTNQLPGGRSLNDMEQSTFSESAMGGTGFGLGFEVVVDPGQSMSVVSPGEFSWGGAASTSFWVDPLEGVTVVFLTQLMPSATFPIRRQLRAAVNQALVASRA